MEEERVKEREGLDKENLGNGHAEQSEEETELKKSKKEKKSKKSKKKSKKKGRDSDSECEDEEKASKKKKNKKDKKKKDKDHVSHVEENGSEGGETRDDENDTDENDRSSGAAVSPRESIDEKQSDQSKFINSFSEAKVENTKNKLSLPTLVFNDKTEELAPKEPINETIDDQVEKDDSFETKLSKWEEDEFNLEAQQIREAAPQAQAVVETSSLTGLRKALSDMERDNKKRKSKSIEKDEEVRNGQENSAKKKKKKRKSISDAESEETEDEENKNKKKKKKKKGIDIPEKTLKKLLKRNLLKKKALENLLKDGPKKKKKKRKSGDKSDPDPSDEDNSGDRVVRRVKSLSQDKKSSLEDEKHHGRKKSKREDSEEGREVKSSKEGNLQVRSDPVVIMEFFSLLTFRFVLTTFPLRGKTPSQSPVRL